MEKNIKRMTSMVLHQIEESLGNFVINHGDIDSLNTNSLENIHKREVEKGQLFNKKSIKDIVEATYINELFGFALDIVNDTSLHDSLNYLCSLFHHLDLYEVRNAISHPNRPFWDCYWYRVASVASDPVNEILGMNEIKKALVSAEAGQIDDPPEEWINKIIWQIPNNLPKSFDHEVTGLIGRSKELNELKKYISNQRINTVALVAPGGAGKTALALDLLNSIVSSPSFTKHVDSVVYSTMKTERLTAEGTVDLDAIETLEELKKNIVESINYIYDEENETYDDIINNHKNDKILLCIDNLETLLRDNPDNFEEFNYSLPPNWQVLVTSRVAISNASILSLEALKEKSAIHLARTYFLKRGGQPLAEEIYTTLTQGCFYNPLAIRLTLDLVLAGGDVPSSLNVANKEIAEFSYNNLINTLSSEAIEILETVFVDDKSTRLSLCELLDKTLDEVSSAIGELSRTSLISRISSDEGEVYNLSDSVRDLLIISPRNIRTRTSVQDKINKRRVLSQEIDFIQKKNEFPIWHYNYIPLGTNENLKILITEVNNNIRKARKDTYIAISLFRKLKDSKYLYDKSELYHRAFARISEILKDYQSAELHYKKAISINNDTPTSKYFLARLYHDTKRYTDAVSTYQEIIDEGWIEKSIDSDYFGKNLYNGYFLSLLYSGNYETVLEVTKKWKDSTHFRGLLGTYRASAWKRKMEKMVDFDPDLTIDSLIRAARIIGDVFRNDGYFNAANIQAKKIFDEIEFCFSRNEFCTKFHNEGIELLNFISSHLSFIDPYNETYNSNIIGKLQKINIEGNPFHSKVWRTVYCVDNYDDSLDDYPEEGLISVKITNRPKDSASYIFARDNEYTDYFLHFENLINGDWRDWCQLSIGMKLKVKPDLGPMNGKAVNANEIYISA